MNRVRFDDEASKELLAETVYYSRTRSGVGVRFVQAVESAVARISSFPQAGTPGPGGTRRIRVRGSPFSVHYRADAEGIVVFALAHHARRPGYWLHRTESE